MLSSDFTNSNMGVKGTHRFLKKRGFNPIVFSSPTSDSLTTIHVDLLGSHYPLIVDHFFTKDPTVAAKLIMKKIGEIYSTNCTVLYLDGARTNEKQATTARRLQVREKDLKTLGSLFRLAEEKITHGRTISSSQFSTIARLSRRTFRFTEDMKNLLIATAETEGWKIIRCIGEADVHIGSLDLNENAAVISGDSDLLFYPKVSNLLRPMKNGSFHLYQKSDILATLRLSIPQWISVGIVSGNDYEDNVRGFGIWTNCKLIKDISGTEITDIVTKYLQLESVSEKNETKITFSIAMQIFTSQKQTLVDQPLSLQNPDPLNEMTYKSRLVKLNQSARLNKKAIKAQKGYENAKSVNVK